ncbi:MAG: ferritin-like domain-containing protein [Vicinamibacteraceae bacterium]
MRKDELLVDLVESPVSRRLFAKRLGLAGATVAIGGGALGTAASPVKAAGVSDIDILNFALNLEYLEAEFYTVATTGRRIAELGIDVSGRGASGGTVGGQRVAFDTRLGAVMRELADDEQKHVVFLRTALRGAAVAKPDINLEALGLGFRNVPEFLTLARAFEDVGVSAYGGAAPLVESSKVLAAAAQIALTEAQHAGMLRFLVGQQNIRVPPLDADDVLPPPAGARFFAVDDNALSVVRTPGQVLSIVYASAAGGADRGGFFPSGVNGAIAAV